MTTIYHITRDTVISAALRKLQVVELGITPDSDTVTNAAQALNIMIKAWQSQGIKLWTIDEYTLPLVASQKVYTISPTGSDLTASKPLKVVQAWLRNTNSDPDTDSPINILSQQEYYLIGSKSSTGIPNSIYYNSRVTSGSLSVYPMPDATAASDYELHFMGQRPMTDIDAAGDYPDFPTEWTMALTWGLADQLAIEYGCHINVRNEIAIKAEKYRTELEAWDVEDTPTFFTPDQRNFSFRG